MGEAAAPAAALAPLPAPSPPPAALTSGQGGPGAGAAFFSRLLLSLAHSPRCTARNSMGFRSPYSPEATSITGTASGRG